MATSAQPLAQCPWLISGAPLGLLVVVLTVGQASGQTSRPADEGFTRPMMTVPMVRNAPSTASGFDPGRSPWSEASCLAALKIIGQPRNIDQDTRVHLLYDRANLWIAFRCDYPKDKPPKAEVSERDGRVWRDDSIEILLMPPGMRESCYHVIVNAKGAVYDAHAADDSWNPKLSVHVETHPEHWDAVVGIPFGEMKTQAPRPGQTWNANFGRTVFQGDKGSWAPVLKAYDGIEHFGEIIFGGPRAEPVRFLQVKPVSVGTNTLVLTPRPGLHWRLDGYDNLDAEVMSESGELSERGEIGFFLADDAVRTIHVSVLGANDKQLSRSVHPVETPQVTARLRRLQACVAELKAQEVRFPDGSRAQLQKLLTEIAPALGEAEAILKDRRRYCYDEWRKLDESVSRLTMLTDAAWCYARTLSFQSDAGFGVGLEGPMRKVMIRDFPFEGWVSDHYQVSLARNEHEGLQAVIVPYGADLEDASVTVSPLRAKSKDTPMPGGRVEVSLVGHVDVADNTPYPVDYKGWWPDPLLSFLPSCSVAAGEHVAFWIDVATGPETPAGDYEATITATAKGCHPVEIRLDVHVWEFELPTGTYLRNAFTYNEPMVGRFYRDRWGPELIQKYRDFILDHRLNIDHLYRRNPPEIEMLKHGAKRGMNAFNVGGVFRRGRNDEPSQDLVAYTRRLKKEGLFDFAYVYGYDEVKAEKFDEMREVFGAVHKFFPGLETMTTAQDHSFGRATGLREVVDIWVPLTDRYDLAEAKKLRAEGREMWWYICVVPVHPYANWFVEYPAIEARLLLGAMSYKYEAGGFLYYLINLWDVNHGVVTKGPYADWDPGSLVNEEKQYVANGDGSLLCPGPDGPLSTIRLENIRDGLEDYDYLYMLAELRDVARKRSSDPACRAFVERAEELLAVPDELVFNLTKYTRDPQVLADFRSRVAEAILEGRKLTGR